jgi:hypothetical protein
MDRLARDSAPIVMADPPESTPMLCAFEHPPDLL